MSILETPIRTIDGTDKTLGDFAGGPMLIVNVASRCGLTPQYAGLQTLFDRYGDRGLTVLGFPCNQFMGQEPGTEAEIAQFCSNNYDVSFPLFAKIDVNGADRHPLYARLTETADADGEAGDVQWNFEKFLLDGDGTVLARIRPRTEPLDPSVTTAIETALGDTAPVGVATMRHADQPTVEVSTHVDAPPEEVWPLICRIELPSATSDELSTVWWEDGADGPARAGRRFVGTNRNDHFGEWRTVSTIDECDEPRAFAWHVGDLDDPNSRWRFTLDPDAGGTRLTQWAQLGYGPSGMHSAIARFPDAEEQIVTARLEQWRKAMRATLDAVKATAEAARGRSAAG